MQQRRSLWAPPLLHVLDSVLVAFSAAGVGCSAAVRCVAATGWSGMTDSSALWGRVLHWACASSAMLIVDHRALVIDHSTAIVHYGAIVDRNVSARANAIASTTTLNKAMFAPAMRVTIVGPGAYAEKNSVIEVARSVVARGCTLVRSIAVVAIGAGWRRAAKVDADRYLSIDSGGGAEGKK